jgi:hypothetical protein
LCGERGRQDGSPLQSLFDAPKGLAVSPDGALAVIADAGNHAIRSLSICDNAVCEYGRWRGPCDVTYMGKCVGCTKSINSTITKAATPFNQDTCEWECSVGHWQVLHCTPRPPCSFSSRSEQGARVCLLMLPLECGEGLTGCYGLLWRAAGRPVAMHQGRHRMRTMPPLHG